MCLDEQNSETSPWTRKKIWNLPVCTYKVGTVVAPDHRPLREIKRRRAAMNDYEWFCSEVRYQFQPLSSWTQTHQHTHFWQRWSCEYLNKFTKWRHPQRNISVAILREDNLVPTRWPLARVVQVYPGRLCQHKESTRDPSQRCFASGRSNW